MTVSPLHALTSRRSMKFLRAPAPKQEELDQILQAAMSAPDHGKLRPWRFVLIRGAAIGRLADRALDAVKRSGDPRMTPEKEKSVPRSEEHTSELQPLRRISYAVFCLKKKKKNNSEQQPIKMYNINAYPYNALMR